MWTSVTGRQHFSAKAWSSSLLKAVFFFALSFFSFNMAAALQIPRVFPRVSCHKSAKATQFPHPGLKIGDQS